MKRKTISTIILAVMIAGHISCIDAYAQGANQTYTALEMDILEVADEFDLSPHFLASLIWQESNFIVKDNLTQITNKKWFQEGIDYVGSDDITDEHTNIRICGYYLHKWFEEFDDTENGGNPHLVLRCWNEGYENALRNPDATSYYSREIIRRAELWEKEYPVSNFGKE